MVDACTLNTSAEVIAHFVLIGSDEFTTVEGDDMIELNCLTTVRTIAAWRGLNSAC